MKLFEGSDDGEDISNIEINKEYARRFEHNKKREDLQRFEELWRNRLIRDAKESSEESDEEVEDLGKKDLQFYETLVRVKKKDPIINQKDVKFFESDEEDEKAEETDENKQKKNKEKPMYLKDVMAKQLIEDGLEFRENVSKTHVKSYAEEQEEVRKAFLDAAQEAFNEDEGDLLTVKKPIDDNKEDDGEIQRRLDEYFGDDGELNENEMFLKNYLLKQMWNDKDEVQKPSAQELEEIFEEEKDLFWAEAYETTFNFRYEEEAGDRIFGHARNPEGSVRIKSNARKSQRQRKEERENQKRMEMEQELKHLKNLKMQEILGKLNKIRAVAGIKHEGACGLDEYDLEKDFDPEEYDKKMRETFGVDYYEAEDADPGFESGGDDDVEDIGKPDFDKEDKLLGLPKDWDEPGSHDGFLAVRERVLRRKQDTGDGEDDEENDGEDGEEDDVEDDEENDGEDGEEDDVEDGEEDDVEDGEENDGEDGEEDDGEDGEEDDGEENDGDELHDGKEEEEEKVLHESGKRKRKRKISLREKVAVEKELEEYYKLDYEDTIGDLKTRFKYASVPSNRYGLTSEEILVLDDKDLNQYVSLKKLAPYSQTEYKVSKQKRYHLKKNKKSYLQEAHSEGQNDKNNNKKTKKELYDEEEKAQMEKSNDEPGTSRRSRRRQRQTELKLSHSRLLAYGK